MLNHKALQPIRLLESLPCEPSKSCLFKQRANNESPLVAVEQKGFHHERRCWLSSLSIDPSSCFATSLIPEPPAEKKKNINQPVSNNGKHPLHTDGWDKSCKPMMLMTTMAMVWCTVRGRYQENAILMPPHTHFAGFVSHERGWK